MKSIIRNKLESHRGHTVLSYAEEAKPIVVDCGAHKGEFARSVAAEWQATCYSIEANPLLFGELRMPSGSKAFNFAVGGRDGEIQFGLSTNPEASRLGEGSDLCEQTVTVPARSLGKFLMEQGLYEVDLLKLDVEGAEVEALASLAPAQLERIAQISVEFHDFCGFVTEAAVDDAINRLHKHGFVSIPFSLRTRGDVLFINTRYYKFGSLDRVRLGVAATAWRAMKRALSRNATKLARTFRP